MKHEQQRIKKLSKWYKEIFIKSKTGENVQSASFYTIPVKLTSSWKAAIAETGEYNYIGLSALYNSPNILLLALFPENKPCPQEYQLICTEEAKKFVIYNTRLHTCEYCLIIEEWSYLPSEFLYVDVPYERKITKKFIEENLIQDENIALSLSCPIMGAPYEIGSVGGTAFSSLHSVAPFAKEFIETVQLIIPPEYRDRNFSIPKSLIKGYNFGYTNGIEYIFAEKIPHSNNNLVRGVITQNYERIKKEVLNRSGFMGEYSIFSTISPAEGYLFQIWKELFKNYTLTEITLPYDLNDLVEADINLRKTRREINEELWIQIVYARQLKPFIPSEIKIEKMVEMISKDFDALLTDIHSDTERDYIVRSMLYPLRYNVKRVAQSITRSDEKNTVDWRYLEKARHLMVDNFHGFLMHPKIKKLLEKIEKRKRDARFSIVETELINNPRSTLVEIFEAVKGEDLFKDIYDLQRFFDWLEKNGYVISDARNRYTWVKIS